MAHMCMYLSNAARQNGAKILTVSEGQERTAREVHDRVAALAATLQDWPGWLPGTRVAVLAQSNAELLELLLAVMAAGGVYVPMNLRWASPEIAAAITLSQAHLLVVDSLHQPAFQALTRACPCIQGGVLLGRSVPGDPSEPQICSESLISGRLGCELTLCTPPDGAAVICFTSGTTAAAKGVVLSHAAFHAQVSLVFRE